MKGLDINIRNNHEISIMDTNHDLDISESKWDFLINCLLEITEHVYFYGLRLDYYDDNLEKNINFLSEEKLFNKHDGFRILFRLKPSYLVVNRAVLKNVWDLYESPSIIFLKDINYQNSLQKGLFENIRYIEALKEVGGVCILYKSLQPDVLWLLSNEVIPGLPIFDQNKD